jgi:hypothetical protein
MLKVRGLIDGKISLWAWLINSVYLLGRNAGIKYFYDLSIISRTWYYQVNCAAQRFFFKTKPTVFHTTNMYVNTNQYAKTH